MMIVIRCILIVMHTDIDFFSNWVAFGKRHWHRIGRPFIA
jgi:hypothetical protein